MEHTNTLKETIINLKLSALEVYPESKTMQAVVITQALLESGYIQRPEGSILARKANNLFGIKGRGNAGSVTMPTFEHINGRVVGVKDVFAKYATVADCFQSHKVLMNKPRYAKVLVSGTPEEAFKELKISGYATDTKYPEKLTSVYNRYVKE